MTDEPASRNLRWWQFIGPWPIRPLAVTLFAGFYFTFNAAASVVLDADLLGDVGVGANVLSIIAAAAVVWALLFAAQRWEERGRMNLAAYILIFFISSIAGVLVRSYIGQLADRILESPGYFLGTVARVAVPLLAINSIIGLATARLAAQVNRTEAALTLARQQQNWMIQADEQARRQVADTLHDRVQANLIAACLQLQGIDPTDRSGIDEVIDRLESLRKFDVRRAARALSPTLSEVGLASSLAELASQYEPTMVTSVRVHEHADGFHSKFDERTRLGCYRIIEQALLNSAVHGRATACMVNIDVTTELDASELSLTVVDDGIGFSDLVPQSGSGSALISTWVRTLGGQWSWGSLPDGGVRVTVRLRMSHL